MFPSTSFQYVNFGLGRPLVNTDCSQCSTSPWQSFHSSKTTLMKYSEKENATYKIGKQSSASIYWENLSFGMSWCGRHLGERAWLTPTLCSPMGAVENARQTLALWCVRIEDGRRLCVRMLPGIKPRHGRIWVLSFLLRSRIITRYL